MNVERIYLDNDHNVVALRQASWMVETATDSKGAVVKESWNKVISFHPHGETNNGSKGFFISAFSTMLVSSLLLLLGGPSVIAAFLVIAGTSLFIVGLLRG